MTIRLGLVGLGNWGQRLASTIVCVDDATLVSCYARTPSTRQSFADAHGIQPAESIAKLVADVDGVLVATPHSTHADLVVELAAYGVAIMVEKPLALSSADSDRCIEAARNSGSILQVAHYRRRAPATRMLRQLIEDGSLGALHLLEGHFTRVISTDPTRPWRDDPSEAPVGAMTALGVHIVDNLLYLAGEFPVRLNALSTKIDESSVLDDMTTAQMEFPNGAIGVLTTSLRLPKLITMTAHGSNLVAWSEDDGARCFTMRDSDEDRTPVPLTPLDPLIDNVAHFADCIRTGAAPETGGVEGASVVRVLEAMTQSASHGGQTVEFDL